MLILIIYSNTKSAINHNSNTEDFIGDLTDNKVIKNNKSFYKSMKK